MAVLLGVDTGGTFTDAVLLRDETEVIASAKSLTTRADLAEGIGKAVAAVLAASQIKPEEIAMASLSTTLATNALVEGQGGRVGLVYIGFRPGDLIRHGLSEVLAGDPAIELPGGHDHSGSEQQPLDLRALQSWVEAQTGVSAFAVAGQFATRNPAHEEAASQLIRAVSGKPVSASYQLSSKLNGPKRALTSVLNARLIGMIDGLIERASFKLTALGILAPLMVVRGDGALISAQLARDKPIETILSGPAASLVGARWLTGEKTALVSDIGGTTTDIAVLRNGQPALDPQGAQVGPYRTMVEAVAMRTSGLGGDSEVHFLSEGLQGGVLLGPKRVLPICLAAIEAPDLVHDALDRQLHTALPSEYDGRFVRRIAGQCMQGLQGRDLALYQRLTLDFQPLDKVLKSRLEQQVLRRLLSRGVIQIAALTPSDASHFLGASQLWDRGAAQKALSVFGRRRTGAGQRLAKSPQDMADIIIDQLTRQTSTALLDVAFAGEEQSFGLASQDLAGHILVERGLSGHRGLIKLDAGLNLPVVGLGASAPSYYPAVGARLNCPMLLPQHGDVANAIGAVVGQITMRASGTVTAPTEGVFRVHSGAGTQDFTQEILALETLEQILRDQAITQAKAAGADALELSWQRDILKTQAENRMVFIEARLTAVVSGRPRITA
jgi:N-methylhydantoinase A/oxoprolinase/acetone carboxylase beta subunit